MLCCILGFIFTSIEVLIGYVVPALFALSAWVDKDEAKTRRWLTHFFFLACLRVTLFAFLNWIELGCKTNLYLFIFYTHSGVLNGVIAAVVFILPTRGLDKTIM